MDGDVSRIFPIGTAPIAFQPEYQTTVIQWNTTRNLRKNTLPTLVARYADEFHKPTIYTRTTSKLSPELRSAYLIKLAHYLLKGKLNAKALFSVFLDRSPEVIICLLGL